MYQQGNFPLTQGQKDYTISFSAAFQVGAPSLILVNVFNSEGEDPQEYLDGTITGRDAFSFSFSLVTAPPSNNYVLSWLASDGMSSSINTAVGIPVASFPVYNKSSIPDNTLFPVSLPSSGYKSVNLRWGQVKQLMANAHQHIVSDISDAGAVGQSLVKSANPVAARAIIEAAAAVHTHTVAQLSDSTSIGRDLIKAVDFIAARTLLDAAPADHTHIVAELSDASNLGKQILQSDAANIIGLIGAAEERHTHTVTDLVASSTVSSFLSATGQDSARTAIAAGNKIGWEATETLNTNRALTSADFGNKFTIGSNVSYTIPTGVNTKGKIGFAVLPNYALTIIPALGVVIYDAMGFEIQGLLGPALAPGFYVLEGLGSNQFVLTGFLSTFQRDIQSTDNKSEFITASGITISDIPGISPTALEALTSTESSGFSSVANKKVWANTSSTTFSDAWTENPAGKGFNVNINSAYFNVESIGSMQDGQSFEIRNAGNNIFHIVSLNDLISFNSLTSGVTVRPNQIISFTKLGEFNLIHSLSDISENVDNIFGYISPSGDDVTASPGDISRPYATLAGFVNAIPNTFSNPKISAIVLPGNYAQERIAIDWNLPGRELIVEFSDNCNVELTNGSGLFTLTAGSLRVLGGSFVMRDAGATFAIIQKESAGKFYAKVNSVIVETIANPATPIISCLSPVQANEFEDYFEAETVVCTQSLFAIVLNGSLVCKVRNLTTGDRAFLMNSGSARLTVDSGVLRCGNTLMSANSASSTLHVNLTNSSMSQGVSGISITRPILNSELPNCTIKVSGYNSSVIASLPNKVANVTDGTLMVSGINLVGQVNVDAGTLILDNARINIIEDNYDYSIDSPEGTGAVTIFGNCITNKNPNFANLTFKGGSIISDTTFTII